MTLHLALLRRADEDRSTVQFLDREETIEARRSGPLINLGITPRPGQLVAVDTTIYLPEIVHVYDQIDAAALTPAQQAALARDTFPAIRARHTPPELPADPDPGSRYMSWTGLAAQVWDLSFATPEDDPQLDHDYIMRVIKANDGPALDIGCGTGRLLLSYRAAGLDVDGLDSSADMLAICRQKAASRGLKVEVYAASMHEFALPRRYHTIFIACGTFCILINRNDALQALRCIYDHLEPGGELVFSLFWEIGKGGWFWRDPGDDWYFMFCHTFPNGDQVFQYMMTDKVDRVEQQFFGRRRYRLVSKGQVTREEIFPSYERVYGKYEIQMMLELTGFRDIIIEGDWTHEPFAAGHEAMVIHARK